MKKVSIYALQNMDAGVGTDSGIWIFLRRQTWHSWHVHMYHFTLCSNIGHQNLSRRRIQMENRPLCPNASCASWMSASCLVSRMMSLCLPCKSHFHNLSSKMKNPDAFFMNRQNGSSLISGDHNISQRNISILDRLLSWLHALSDWGIMVFLPRRLKMKEDGVELGSDGLGKTLTSCRADMVDWCGGLGL